MPMPMPVAGFFLFRAGAPGEAFDPTAVIQFYPPKDSDELFDALRAAYPASKTHADRMRNAVIDFLIKERDEEQAKTQMAETPSTWSSWTSGASSSSTFSSPDLIDLATPASETSPVPSMSRLPSRSSTAGRSSMEQMTSVFSLSTNPQPKSRIRRKMTEGEKTEYRKRRIVKACDKCSKRKRKCHHNQEQMDDLNASRKGKKRTSPISATSTVAQTAPAPSPAFAEDLDFESFVDEQALFSLETTTQAQATNNMNLMDMDFDQDLATSGVWPWSDTQDWTLMDSGPANNVPFAMEPLFDEFIHHGSLQQSRQSKEAFSMGSHDSHDGQCPAMERQPVMPALGVHDSVPQSVAGNPASIRNQVQTTAPRQGESWSSSQVTAAAAASLSSDLFSGRLGLTHVRPDYSGSGSSRGSGGSGPSRPLFSNVDGGVVGPAQLVRQVHDLPTIQQDGGHLIVESSRAFRTDSTGTPSMNLQEHRRNMLSASTGHSSGSFVNEEVIGLTRHSQASSVERVSPYEANTTRNLTDHDAQDDAHRPRRSDNNIESTHDRGGSFDLVAQQPIGADITATRDIGKDGTPGSNGKRRIHFSYLLNTS